MDSGQIQFSHMSFLGRPISLATSMISAVEVIPWPTKCILDWVLKIFLMSSAVQSVLTSIFTVCRCIRVVGTISAADVILMFGSTLFTSGPWWDGIFTGLSTIALTGPFLISLGSTALLATVTLTLFTPSSLFIGDITLQSPVVLHETTLTRSRPRALS